MLKQNSMYKEGGFVLNNGSPSVDRLDDLYTLIGFLQDGC